MIQDEGMIVAAAAFLFGQTTMNSLVSSESVQSTVASWMYYNVNIVVIHPAMSCAVYVWWDDKEVAGVCQLESLSQTDEKNQI